jgi:hypothetical protein
MPNATSATIAVMVFLDHPHSGAGCDPLGGAEKERIPIGKARLHLDQLGNLVPHPEPHLDLADPATLHSVHRGCGPPVVDGGERNRDRALGVGRHPAFGEQPRHQRPVAIRNRDVDPHLPGGRIDHGIDPLDLTRDPAIQPAHGELDFGTDPEAADLLRRDARLQPQPGGIHDGEELGSHLRHVPSVGGTVAHDPTERGSYLGVPELLLGRGQPRLGVGQGPFGVGSVPPLALQVPVRQSARFGQAFRALCVAAS